MGKQKMCFPWSPPQGYIMISSKGAVVFKKLIEFWRWQSKVAEKKWQERN
jgi:hypothetical protein